MFSVSQQNLKGFGAAPSHWNCRTVFALYLVLDDGPQAKPSFDLAVTQTFPPPIALHLTLTDSPAPALATPCPGREPPPISSVPLNNCGFTSLSEFYMKDQVYILKSIYCDFNLNSFKPKKGKRHSQSFLFLPAGILIS
jgi:hypothetical protein